MPPIKSYLICYLLSTTQTATNNRPLCLYYHRSTALLDRAHVPYDFQILHAPYRPYVVLPDGLVLIFPFLDLAVNFLILIPCGPLL